MTTLNQPSLLQHQPQPQYLTPHSQTRTQTHTKTSATYFPRQNVLLQMTPIISPYPSATILTITYPRVPAQEIEGWTGLGDNEEEEVDDWNDEMSEFEAGDEDRAGGKHICLSSRRPSSLKGEGSDGSGDENEGGDDMSNIGDDDIENVSLCFDLGSDEDGEGMEYEGKQICLRSGGGNLYLSFDSDDLILVSSRRQDLNPPYHHDREEFETISEDEDTVPANSSAALEDKSDWGYDANSGSDSEMISALGWEENGKPARSGLGDEDGGVRRGCDVCERYRKKWGWCVCGSV